MKLAPYKKYKPSNIKWLDDVPAHWEVRRLKYLLREMDSRSVDGKEQLLRVSQYTGVTERKAMDGTDEPDTRATSLVGYKCVERDDLVVNIMLAWNGSMGVSAFLGICSPAYCVYRFNNRALPHYFHNLLRSSTYRARIKAVSTGIVESRLRLYTDDLYRLEGLLPPLPEQTAIVRYLDYVNGRIQRYVRAKQKLIGLLEEQKQAIIHHTVTRGLNPDAPLKPSGVKWLGDVPAHWEVQQLGRIGQFSKGNGGTKEDEVPDGVPCVRYGDIYTQYKYFAQSSRACVTEKKAVNYTPIRYGDVLFAGSGETIEEIGKSVVNLHIVSACCGGDVIIFRACIKIDAKFLGYATDCPQAAYQKSCMGRGITIMHIYSSALKYLWILCPPLPEQAAIVKHLDHATANLNTAITRARREVELLTEYRTRLTADVVTGKLDVRKAAAQLPNDSQQDDPKTAT